MNVLVINAGSSSLKYQLFNMDTKEVLAKGLCERIGIDGRLTHTNQNKDEKFSDNIQMKDHADAIRAVINILIDKEWGVIESMSEIDAVGHRVVHGGEFFADSVLIKISSGSGAASASQAIPVDGMGGCQPPKPTPGRSGVLMVYRNSWRRYGVGRIGADAPHGDAALAAKGAGEQRQIPISAFHFFCIRGH